MARLLPGVVHGSPMIAEKLGEDLANSSLSRSEGPLGPWDYQRSRALPEDVPTSSQRRPASACVRADLRSEIATIRVATRRSRQLIRYGWPMIIISTSGLSESSFLPAWIALLEHGFYRETFQIFGLSPDAALRAPVFRGSRGSPRPVHS